MPTAAACTPQLPRPYSKPRSVIFSTAHRFLMRVDGRLVRFDVSMYSAPAAAAFSSTMPSPERFTHAAQPSTTRSLYSGRIDSGRWLTSANHNLTQKT